MIKPRLMTQSFVNKVLTEKTERVFNIKSVIYSKNLYVFLGILGVCIILFLMFKYFDKKEKKKEEEIKQKEYEEEMRRKIEFEKKNKEEEEFLEQDDDMKVTKIPLKIQKQIHQSDLSYPLKNNNSSNNSEQDFGNMENQENFEYNPSIENTHQEDIQENYEGYESDDTENINQYLDEKNYEFENIQEIEYP